jgi:hypothetical protein
LYCYFEYVNCLIIEVLIRTPKHISDKSPIFFFSPLLGDMFLKWLTHGSMSGPLYMLKIQHVVVVYIILCHIAKSKWKFELETVIFMVSSVFFFFLFDCVGSYKQKFVSLESIPWTIQCKASNVKFLAHRTTACPPIGFEPIRSAFLRFKIWSHMYWLKLKPHVLVKSILAQAMSGTV